GRVLARVRRLQQTNTFTPNEGKVAAHLRGCDGAIHRQFGRLWVGVAARVVAVDAIHGRSIARADRLIGRIGEAVLLHLTLRVGHFDIWDRLAGRIFRRVLHADGRVGMPVNRTRRGSRWA